MQLDGKHLLHVAHESYQQRGTRDCAYGVVALAIRKHSMQRGPARGTDENEDGKAG